MILQSSRVYYYQEELAALAQKIPEWEKRQLFIETVGDNTNYHDKTKDGRVLVGLNPGSSDRDWVIQLAAGSGMDVSAVSFPA